MTAKPIPQFNLNDHCNHFVAHLMRLEPNFIITPQNEIVIKQLVKYFCNIPQDKVDLTKGIFLRGPYGTGKTLIMTAFSNWPLNKRKFRLKKCRDIQKDAANEGFEALIKYTKKSYNFKNQTHAKENGPIDYCFDDLGAEKVTKFYGTEINVMEELILDRYDEFLETKMITHATSNIKDGDLIEKYYSGRSRDRMREMFNFVDLLGKSHRK